MLCCFKTNEYIWLTGPLAHLPRLDRRPKELRPNDVLVQPRPDAAANLHQHHYDGERTDRAPQRRHYYMYTQENWEIDFSTQTENKRARWLKTNVLLIGNI